MVVQTLGLPCSMLRYPPHQHQHRSMSCKAAQQPATVESTLAAFYLLGRTTCYNVFHRFPVCLRKVCSVLLPLPITVRIDREQRASKTAKQALNDMTPRCTHWWDGKVEENPSIPRRLLLLLPLMFVNAATSSERSVIRDAFITLYPFFPQAEWRHR